MHRGVAALAGTQRGVEALPPKRVRRAGAGRKPLPVKAAKLREDLEALVEPLTRGHPQSPLRWTCKSATKLAAALNAAPHRVRQRRVCDRLARWNSRLQSVRQTREGGSHSDRNAPFSWINQPVTAFQTAGQPVISVDTKKKEIIGDFAQKGREWPPQGQPDPVRVHAFIDPELGQVAPDGV